MGKRLVVVGHGVRRRQQTGVGDVDGEPFDDELLVRRYRCRACKALLVIAPRGLLPRLRFRPEAIVVVLALWALGKLSSGSTRKRVSTRTNAHEGYRCWASPRRWLAKAADWCELTLLDRSGSRRARAEAVLQRLAARVRDGNGELVGDAIRAARLLGGHRTRAVEEAASTN